MDMIPSASDVADALMSLTDASHSFRTAVLEPGAVQQGLMYNALDGHELAGDSAELLLRAMLSFDFGDDMENGSVLRFPGCFEVRQSVLACAQNLNAAKDQLKNAVKALEVAGVKPHQIRVMYKSLGHSRIHPLQAWRQIHTLNQPNLESVGFTVAKSIDGIERMSREAILARLRGLGAEDLVDQIEGRPDIKTFRWHVPVAPHIRANVVWKQNGERAAQMFHASLPFLVPEGSWPSKRVRFNKSRMHDARSDACNELVFSSAKIRKGSFIAAG